MIKGGVKGWQCHMYNVNVVRNDATGKDTKESKIIALKALCSEYNTYFRKLGRPDV